MRKKTLICILEYKIDIFLKKKIKFQPVEYETHIFLKTLHIHILEYESASFRILGYEFVFYYAQQGYFVF